MQDMMPFFKSQNVTRLCVEMVQTSKQAILDSWQQGHDENSFPDYLDSHYHAYSSRMWQHYWLMMSAAKDNGIKIVGLDKPEIKSGYGDVFDAPFKTMHWETVIKNEQETMQDGEKFLVYGGELHMIDMGGPLSGIHQRVNVPRILLEGGSFYAAARLLLDKDKKSFIVQVPDVAYQDPPSKGVRNIRSVPVRWSLPESASKPAPL